MLKYRHRHMRLPSHIFEVSNWLGIFYRPSWFFFPKKIYRKMYKPNQVRTPEKFFVLNLPKHIEFFLICVKIYVKIFLFQFSSLKSWLNFELHGIRIQFTVQSWQTRFNCSGSGAPVLDWPVKLPIRIIIDPTATIRWFRVQIFQMLCSNWVLNWKYSTFGLFGARNFWFCGKF